MARFKHFHGLWEVLKKVADQKIKSEELVNMLAEAKDQFKGKSYGIFKGSQRYVDPIRLLVGEVKKSKQNELKEACDLFGELLEKRGEKRLDGESGGLTSKKRLYVVSSCMDKLIKETEKHKDSLYNDGELFTL